MCEIYDLIDNFNRNMLSRGQHIRLQFLATTFANLINVTYGLTIGWFIIYGNKFHTNDNPLAVPPLGHNEVIWIEVSFYIGAIVGIVILTLSGDVFGRKYTLIILIIPQGFAWLLKMISTNATEAYMSRFLSGYSAGGSVNLVILFVAELADDKVRGRLGTILPLSINVGILIMFIADLFVSYSNIAYIVFAVLFIFLCTYTFFPDTPRQLYKIRRTEQAIRSLQVYRDIRDLECQTDDCYQVEVKKIRHNLKSDSGLPLENSSKAIFKSLLISFLLIIINFYVNCFIVVNLTRHHMLDTNLVDLQMFRIFIGVCQLAGSVFCLTIVDFVERRYLLFASIAGITAPQILNGYLELNDKIEPWMSVAVMAIAAFSLHFGVYPLTFVLIPEIIPEKIRAYGVTLVFSFWWALMLAFSLCEQALIDALGDILWPFLIFSILFNLLCSAIFLILTPSTKRRPYRDIFSYLNFEIKV